MSTTRTTLLRSGSPAGRVKSAKSSARSTVSSKSASQFSDVGEALSVTSAVKDKRHKQTKEGKVKNSLQNSSGNKRTTKPTLTQPLSVKNVTKSNVVRPKSSSSDKKVTSKPAWAIKPAHDDDVTPRSNISLATSFKQQHASVNDFLDDYPEDDRDLRFSVITSHNDNRETSKDSKKQSFFDYFSADAEENVTGSLIQNWGASEKAEEEEHDREDYFFDLVSLGNGATEYSRKVVHKNDEDDDDDDFEITKNFEEYEHISYSSNELKIDTRNNGENNGRAQSNHRPPTTNKAYPVSLEKQISLLERREAAAKCIQLWWRKVNIRRTAGAAALRRMMQDKQKQMEARITSQRKKEVDQKARELDQTRRREEKARAARQNAIDDMQRKRSGVKPKEKKDDKKTKTSLSNGVCSKAKTSSRPLSKAVLAGTSSSVLLNDEKPGNETTPRPVTSSSVGRKIEEIFEASSKHSPSVTSVPDPSVCDDDNTTLIASDEKVMRSTYDDLLNTIKQLEADPVTTSPGMAEMWGRNVESDHIPGLSEDTVRRLDVPDLLPNPGAYLSADKLQNILTFLDEVEKVEEDVRSEVLRQSKEASLSEVGSMVEQLSLNEAPDSMMESASMVANDISNAILAKKQEIDEKKKSLEMMKKAMGQQKEFATMQMVEMDKEHKQQLKLQRDEYESNVQRHLTFIDQLIDDKKALTDKCEDLVTKLKDVDQKYSTKIKQLCENHAVEMKKQKEISEAAEKLRREKWIREKTQEIKEITVKGLEPDIQKLIAKHKAEIKKIKAMKQGEVLDADERVGRKYIQQMEDLRAQLDKEKENAVKKERELAMQRFESQMREEEGSFQQQRRRLHQEIEEEKERCNEQMAKYKKECDEKQNAIAASFKQTAGYTQADHEKQVEKMRENHKTELKKYKEQVDIEKEQWLENYMKKQETQLLAKERELKEGVKDSRDKEIEMVIARLEKEATDNREESEKAAENRIKRLRDKYEKEIKELEESEKSLRDKNISLKEQAAEFESAQLQLKSECKQKDQDLVDTKNITQRLQDERSKVTDVIRQEFADRLVVLEEESKRLRTELSEEKSRHKYDVDKLQKNKEEEMDELHKRVKKAIANKDENTRLLKDKMQAAEKRAEHLEQLLADQRKKLLGE